MRFSEGVKFACFNVCLPKADLKTACFSLSSHTNRYLTFASSKKLLKFLNKSASFLYVFVPIFRKFYFSTCSSWCLMTEVYVVIDVNISSERGY